MAYRRKRRYYRRRRYLKKRTFKRRISRRLAYKKRRKTPYMRIPRRQTRSAKYRVETFALPLTEYSAGEYTLTGTPAVESMPIVPRFNYIKIFFTKDEIDKQINGSITDQYGAFKILSATTEWRLDTTNTSNYYMNETKTGSFLDNYGDPLANQVQIDETLQAPYGRFHSAKGGRRTYWPKWYARETLQYLSSVGSEGEFTSVVPQNRWVRSTINGNCQWRGLSLLLPGLGSINQTTAGSTQGVGQKQYIPKWQIRTYVKIAFSNYQDYDKIS